MRSRAALGSSALLLLAVPGVAAAADAPAARGLRESRPPEDPTPLLVGPTPTRIGAAGLATRRPSCPTRGRTRAKLRLDVPGPVAPGATVGYTLTDTGATCLRYTAGWGWERRADDGAWQAWPEQVDFPAVMKRLTPGGVEHAVAQVPPDATPGRFRLVVEVWGQRAPGERGPRLRPSAEIDVVS
jgi:hypothetical protein